MPRQVRIEFPGAVYHAMARGDRREDIVRDDGDREAFVSLLGELVDRTGWEGGETPGREAREENRKP